MSSLVDLIKSLNAQIETGQLEGLRSALQSINQITSQQLNLNQRQIAPVLQQLVQNINRAVRKHAQQVENADSIIKPIKTLLLKSPPMIRRQLNPLIRQITVGALQGQKDNFQERLNEQNQIMIQKIVQNDLNDNTNSVTVRNVVGSQLSLSPIQQSVKQYQSIFSYRTNLTRPQDLPPTMQILSQYAGIQGYNQVGSISNERGLAYVGTKKIQKGNGLVQVVPYEKNQIPKTTIPSITMQLQYHANNAINSWNNYIRDQAKFVDYFQKVNNSDARLKYVQDQFTSLNVFTFSAQVVASFMFYYYYLPLMKYQGQMARVPGLKNTYESFLNMYSMGDNIKMNPLILSNKDSKQIITKIVGLTNSRLEKRPTPIEILMKLIELVQNKKNSLNGKEIIKMKSHTQIKTAQAKQFMSQVGLQDITIQRVLASENWTSIIMKKANTPSMQNRQYAQIAMKIITKNQKKEYQPMTYDWGSPRIPCHDYLWNWQLD